MPWHLVAFYFHLVAFRFASRAHEAQNDRLAHRLLVFAVATVIACVIHHSPVALGTHSFRSHGTSFSDHVTDGIHPSTHIALTSKIIVCGASSPLPRRDPMRFAVPRGDGNAWRRPWARPLNAAQTEPRPRERPRFARAHERRRSPAEDDARLLEFPQNVEHERWVRVSPCARNRRGADEALPGSSRASRKLRRAHKLNFHASAALSTSSTSKRGREGPLATSSTARVIRWALRRARCRDPSPTFAGVTPGSARWPFQRRRLDPSG